MPELPDDMYCSQQICIPPTFPYLLRQYAKAAIRTQPTDLLRWSTAYFRCLALNLPPPVKPRLEYPIPKSHFGLTPGWLKALMYQLQSSLSVSFKVLWDRWMGACLQHENLIEVLCVGGFTNPLEIPWFRFVSLCAAYLTENLTQTMILFCEIITEEPEGGSAMIPLEIFIDVYEFLSRIDASQPQTLHNLYFTDSLLSLYKEPPVLEERESISEAEEEIEEESVKSEKVETAVKKVPKKQVGVVISCPDIIGDDYKSEEDFALTDEPQTEKDIVVTDEPEKSEQEDEAADAPESADVPEVTEAPEGTEAPKGTDVPEVTEAPEGTDAPEQEIRSISSRELLEDLEKVKKAQQAELPGAHEEVMEEETDVDHELEKLKGILAAPPGMIQSELFTSEVSEEHQESSAEEAPLGEEVKAQEIYVDAIPGIGAIVPEQLIEAVVGYMRERAKKQHGMVMPRNIRHYTCPPLEVI